MRVWVVRHACAGHKEDWSGDDDDRPLDPAGEAQAAALADLLAPERPTRLVASPTRRCVDTLVPLAARVGLPIETDDRLRAGADRKALVAFLFDPANDGAVACTHGEVMAPLLEELRSQGLTGDVDDERLLFKGAAWLLTRDGGTTTLRLRVPVPLPTCPHHRA